MSKSNMQTTVSTDTVEMAQAVMTQVDDAGLGPIRWMGTAWLEKLADINAELARFVADRIREDVKAQHDMLHCKSTKDLQAAQVAFIETAYAQYRAQTGKLVKMGLDMMPAWNSETNDIPL